MSGTYQLVFARNVQRSLEYIPVKHHAAIRDSILEQLPHQPLLETRNRKPLNPAILGATWELHCGLQNRYRVLYEVVDREADDGQVQEVHVLLIGEKISDHLMVFGLEANNENDSNE